MLTRGRKVLGMQERSEGSEILNSKQVCPVLYFIHSPTHSFIYCITIIEYLLL